MSNDNAIVPHTRSSIRHALLLVVIGAVLRLSTPSSIEFTGDEVAALDLGIQLMAAHPWSSSEPWPQHGLPSSQGIANPPLFNWIMAIIWALTRSPVGATAIVAFLNSVSLLPLWFWARRRIGNERALLAVAALAVSPFAVILSRRLWAQELLLPGLVVLLWGLEWLRSDKPWRGLVMFALGALLVGQLHQSGPIALALLPIAVVVQWLADKRRGRPPLRWGAPSAREAAALLLVLALHLFFWLPYLQYLAGRRDDFLSGRFMVACCSPDLLRELVRQLVPRGLLWFIDGEDFLKEPVFAGFYYAAVGLGVPITIYGVWRWLRSPLSVPVLGVWWLLIIAAFAYARIRTFQFYLLILAPLPALLIAGAFDSQTLTRLHQRALAVVRWSYVACLAGVTVSTLTWIAERGGSPTYYGVSYGVREQQARAALRLVSVSTDSARANSDSTTTRDGSLHCSALPMQVIWIVGWLNQQRNVALDDLRLCDDWRQENGRLQYRWTVTIEP